MKKLSIWMLLAVGVAACNQNSMKTTPDGLEYKFLVDKPGKTAKLGDVIKFNMVIKNSKDSVLRDTRKEGNPIITNVQKSPFKGALDEGFVMLSEGDSVEFLVNADSLFNFMHQPSPPFIAKGSKIKYIVSLEKILTPEEVKKEQETAMQKHMEAQKKQMEEQQKQIEQDDVLIKDYIAKNNLKDTLRSPSGVYYVPKEKGKGAQAMAGDTVKVHYTGKLLNGRVFDSSVERGQPFEFTLGRGMVIPGWDEGIALMKVGDKGTLLIPSPLAYGPAGSGAVIPPNSVLIFDVELLGKK